MRYSEIERVTKETQIKGMLNLDGQGRTDISTDIGFFDHMLTAFAVHSGFDLGLICRGDTDVDSHHTIEDVGIVLGQAFAKALGDKKGIARYGFFMLPMDEALATCAVDISGRDQLVFNCDFRGELLGQMDSQMVAEFFKAFASNAMVTIHLNLDYGDNDHHKCEALFKAFAHALKAAVKIEGNTVLSSKGRL
jgi:imidazoleglycerol-phosphate dehydratase